MDEVVYRKDRAGHVAEAEELIEAADRLVDNTEDLDVPQINALASLATAHLLMAGEMAVDEVVEVRLDGRALAKAIAAESPKEAPPS